MDDDRPVVVKVGGSLLAWEGLRERLAEFLASDELRDREVVLIAGGGSVADAVRLLDATHGLGEEAAHRLALRAMDVTARALAALVDGSRVVEALDDGGSARCFRDRPILAPRLFMEEIDERSAAPPPRSWVTTSDSIAARVALHLGARLILLKSESTAAGTREEAAASGHVDPAFPRASAGLDRVESINLRDPGRPTVRLD